MWRSITIFTSVCHWSLYSARLLQSTPSDPISSRPLLTLILLTWRIGWALNNASKWQMGFNLAFKGLILYSQLCLGFYIVSFLQVFQPKSCIYFSFLPSMPATCPSHPILLQLLKQGVQIMCASVCNRLQPPVTSSLSQTFFSNPCSQTPLVLSFH